MVRRFEPSSVLRLIQEEKATAMSLVPTMANALLNCPDLGKFDTSSMKVITTGRRRVIARADRPPGAGLPLRGMLGLRSHRNLLPCSPRLRPKATVTYADEADRLNHLAAAGWPLLGSEVRVVDSQMRDVPRDMEAVGEVVVRGDNVMDGYYNEPEATKAVMTNGWLHTGDMAVWDEENYIHIVDRKKDIIISGGENISSIEVEKAIFAHPAVLECAVVSAPDQQWGEIPVAIIVLKPNQQLNRRRIDVIPEATHRQVQDAPPGEVRGRTAAEDRHRQNAETRTARKVLERKSNSCARLTRNP